ncbi:hypothetical protein PIB30_006985 [Stylosanthes scabra]|uniref:Uncharacterized protein n=1 Tax=Stylosanthes scabra TaxID=79078 RepID=A0ABU6Z3I7_9FABA|nr:hypothetical protein [Stylosanthes scabra]
MFQRPRTVALEYEKPGTYGTVLIYPLNRLVECGFVDNMAINPWVDIACRRQAFARDTLIHGLATLLSVSLFISLLIFVHTLTQLQPPNFPQPKSTHALTRWENDPSSVLSIFNWLQVLVTLFFDKTFFARIHNLFGFRYDDLSFVFTNAREPRTNLVYDV